MNTPALLLLSALLTATGSPAHEPFQPEPTPDTASNEEPGFWEALAGGTTSLKFRYRLEYGDSDAFADEALTSTLRTVLGYRTASYEGFEAFVEFEDVSVIGDDNYNSLSNGMSDHAVVVDPAGTAVNQGLLRMTRIEGLDVKLGRQEIVHDSARFVGNVAWRQNFQSFDAARVTWAATEDLTVDYAYLDQVNRIFGQDSPSGDEEMSTHLLNVWRDLEGVGRLTGYAYLIDFDDSTDLSSSTFGARLKGAVELSEDYDLTYTAELAKQTDYATNDVDLDEDYYLGELGVRRGSTEALIGFERLGGSGDPGEKFSTPFATLHKFNGYADIFLNTPDEGLDDLYLKFRGKVGTVKCLAAYHEFESDAGSIDYGAELDLDFVVPINEHVSWGVRFARFDADDRFADTTKVIGSLMVHAF